MFQPSYGLITDIGELREIAQQLLADNRAVAFDIETGYEGESRAKASLHPEENFITGLSLTNSLKWSRYVPLRHDTGPRVDERQVAEVLYPLLVEARDDTGLPLGVAHGGKFELRVMRPWFSELLGLDLDYQVFKLRSDSMLESYVQAVSKQHGLKELTEEQAITDRSGFWHKQLELEDLYEEKLTAKQKKCIRFNVLNPLDPRVQRYVCEDTIYSLAHHRMRYPQVRDNFIYKLEMSVLPVVCAMEDEGIWYDWNGMRDWARKAKAFAARYMEEIREDFGELRGEPLEPNFNFGSPIQLARLLYDECGMPIHRRTKTGRPGTDAKVALKGLSKEYAQVRKFLEWKRLVKLYRDYMEKFEEAYCFAGDGRAHPSLLQHGVPAGRFAHADPNYAQAPKKYSYTLRDGEAFVFNYRTMIGAPPGWYQLGFDLAQAELRAVAGMAREENMFAAFEQGIDVHSVTASRIYGIPVDQVTPEQREVGKTMGLALTYGLTPEGLADRLGITVQEAEDLFAAYHAAYPRIAENTEKSIRLAKDTGYVTTWWGRRVRIWDIDSADRRKRLEAQRTAGNAPVQGSATGDYMKIAMVRADAALRKAGLLGDVRLSMNIHDALEWYVRETIDPAIVIRVLEPAVIFPVSGWPPMIAEWHVGRRWGAVQELEVLPSGKVRVKKKEAKADLEIDLGDEDEDDVAPARALPALAEIRAAGLRPDPGQVPVADAAPAGQGGHGLGADTGMRSGAAGDVHPRTVVIEPLHGVAKDRAQALIVYLLARGGPNTVILRLDTGDVRANCLSSVSPQDEAELSVLLGGARVYYDQQSVDLAAVSAGVEL